MKMDKNVQGVNGPLLLVSLKKPVAYGEICKIKAPDGEIRTGQVLESAQDYAVVQVFEGTEGLDTQKTAVGFTGETLKFGVSADMLGRVMNGSGRVIDGGVQPVPEESLDITGAAINPYSRDQPSDFIETGISTIDGMNTLVRGQKLPIFSGSGLPHNELAVQIARQASVGDEGFAVVFAAMGITFDEAHYFYENFKNTGALERTAVFLNLANDPVIERIMTPRLALTLAEYLAYEQDLHVLVILTDMTNYCEALRQISAARKEVPGRRGYPGYLYTDLATIYERAGRIKGRKGSITQIPILSMPGDDITHTIPDLTGYITEGQIVLSRDLHRKGVYPPVNVLLSLSRLMSKGIGKGKTREDHSGVSNQLYAAYAEGLDVRDLVSLIGEEAVGQRERAYLRFAEAFENRFVKQGSNERRSIEDTLNIAWDLLSMLPEDELKKVKPEHISKYMNKNRMSQR